LEQQTATSEVLQVISSAPGELEPVFSAMLEKAARISDAKFGGIYRWDGDALHLIAAHNTPPEFAEYRRRTPLRPDPKSPSGRMIAAKTVVHVADVTAEQAYTEHRVTATVAAVELGGVRTALLVPMLKENDVIGAFTLSRQEVRPFTDKQIALVTNFAAQAVIAIENARLLSELRESLQEQTASAEVLQVIRSSPGDVQPVFAAMLEKAVRICDAKFGNIHRWDGDALHLVAAHNTPPAFAEARGRSPRRPGPTAARMVATKTVVHAADLATEQAYAEQRDPATVEAVELGGVRTFLAVPMLKENELIGSFSLYRQEVRPFTEKQIDLVTNFAAQAVIAIENARLLNELRQSLEEQTATSEVLQVISSSPGDLEPVFAAMLEKAVRICDAKFGNIYRWDGEMLVLVATQNTPPEFAEVRRSRLLRHTPNDPVGRMIGTKSLVHTADLSKEPEYIERSNPALIAAVEVGGVRTSLQVPILKEDELIGALSLSRQEVRPFTDKQIELLKNFAAQAVIAIENARLLKELRGRTEEVEKLNYHLEQRVVDQVGEIERMGRLRRFLPPQVADLIVASGTEKQLESHRREITALFCDLRGFTGFTESADAEDVMALLREYHAAIGEIIIRYNGTLERYAGDGVMVVFNDPIPVDNPALQAVQMALEMREAIGALTEKWRQLGHEIGFGIGIAHGYATLGTIGFEGRFDYAAIGTVSNVASRLCDEAKPGQILVSPRVLVAVRDAVAVEAVGEFELKGIRRPIAAYNVLAALPPSP
jgi:class 3 adenylate cyclase/putative methionine-R-sulfoxide reductase with GAF domain